MGTSLAVPVTRAKRDILPGDPRYGTDYHHHHHHHHEEHAATNSNSGYNYNAPATSETHQLPTQTYGAPFNPMRNQPAPPSTSYGTPVVHQQQYQVR